MPDQVQYAPAKLVEIQFDEEQGGAHPTAGGTSTEVQFNPGTLKVSKSNTVAQSNAAGSAAMQYVGATSTKLDVELWFDVSVMPGERRLRDLTEKVYYFITPRKANGNAKFVVPGVRFHWGDFLFDGVLTSLNETLELFSSYGQPLRSRMALSFASQDMKFRVQEMTDGGAQAGGAGQTPQTPIREGDSVQQVAARLGRPNDWKSVAAENGIENPRLPRAGILLRSAAIAVRRGGR